MDTQKEVNITDKDKYAAIGSQSNDIKCKNDLVVI